MALNPCQPPPLSGPKLRPKDLLRQFWADAYGKEVQSAATYSYLWLADQFGHVCIGIIVDFLATAVSGLIMVLFRPGASLTYNTGVWPGLMITIVAVGIWELCAYRSSVAQATGTFPLDKKLLRDNAMIAWAYMSLGGILGFAFHAPLFPQALTICALVVILAIVLAPNWLRQKIIWQRAGIPYLFRLADAIHTINPADASLLQAFIDQGSPTSKPEARQVIVGGPIGSGRTSMAAGIATEFAFKKNKVRYLGFDALLEYAAHATDRMFPDDTGPVNISYWPWSEAQVTILDGVGPFVAGRGPDRGADIQRFEMMLKNQLKSVASVLSRCHTVWVVGDLTPPLPPQQFSQLLNEFARCVAQYCDASADPLVVELDLPPAERANKGAIFGSTRASARVAAVKHVRHVANWR